MSSLTTPNINFESFPLVKKEYRNDRKYVRFYKHIQTENGYKNILHNKYGPAVMKYKKYAGHYRLSCVKFYLKGKLCTSKNYEPYEIRYRKSNGSIKSKYYYAHLQGLTEELYYPNGKIQAELYSDTITETAIWYKESGEVDRIEESIVPCWR